MFLLIIFILGIITITLWEKVVAKYNLELLGGCIIGITVLSAFIVFISYPCSLGNIARMEAFYDTNRFVYEKAVKEFPNSGRAITKDDATTVVTLPYDRIKLIANYNENLTWYKRYQENWFTSGFVSKVPSDLKYIMP